MRAKGAEGGVSEGKCIEREKEKKSEGKRSRSSRFPLKKERRRRGGVGVGVGGGGLFFGELPPRGLFLLVANGPASFLPLSLPRLPSSSFFSPPQPSSRRRCSCSSGLKTRRRGLPVFVFRGLEMCKKKKEQEGSRRRRREREPIADRVNSSRAGRRKNPLFLLKLQ